MKNKRKKLTPEIIEMLLKGELAIWIWAQIDNQERPVQMVFPGKPILHKCYPQRNSYFEVANADDKFYFKEYDYFWFVCKNEPPKDKKEEKDKLEQNKEIMEEAYSNPEAMPKA